MNGLILTVVLLLRLFKRLFVLSTILGHVHKERGLALTSFSFFLRRVYKAARVTRVGGLPYLRARITLTGGLTFSLSGLTFYLFQELLSVTLH